MRFNDEWQQVNILTKEKFWKINREAAIDPDLFMIKG